MYHGIKNVEDIRCPICNNTFDWVVTSEHGFGSYTCTKCLKVYIYDTYTNKLERFYAGEEHLIESKIKETESYLRFLNQRLTRLRDV